MRCASSAAGSRSSTGRRNGAAASTARRSSSSNAFAEFLRVVWLTPAMDALFAGPASERRRFLDRFVLAIDPNHGARVNHFERALRGRNRLLEEGARNAAWLDAIEREAAELGVAVAAARVECVQRLKALDRMPNATIPRPFHGPSSRSRGTSRRWSPRFRRSRPRSDTGRSCATIAAATPPPGGTLVGPHVGDLLAWHGPKGAPAGAASTGEQKALLVGLVLAHARLVAEMSGIAPLALFDEVAAHFDPRRRAALFDALERIGGQVFLTGADPAAFADLDGRAQGFAVSGRRRREAAQRAFRRGRPRLTAWPD